jgi:hypothetical protein
MNITESAELLNSMAIDQEFKIAALPDLRKRFLEKKKLPANIFTIKSIFKDYAFHIGGRKEWQFNFGLEYIGNKRVTRFALCLSLEPSSSLLHPIESLEPYRKRFNDCLKKHPEYFNSFKMWYYHNEIRSANYLPQTIPNEWFKFKNFIAVGKIIPKSPNVLNEKDLSVILRGFDDLLPIYEYCVLRKNSLRNIKENRISRICWNDNDWEQPSGKHGKSGTANSHENEKGFGYEEWLFDFEKIIDGYHYAFLQPVQKGRNNFLHSLFDVKLYSRNSETGELFWVGIIKDLEVITNEESVKAHNKYKKSGWLNEMAKQLKENNANSDDIIINEPYYCFNVRFRPENAKLFDPYKTIEDFDKKVGTYHYVFVKDKTINNTTIPNEVLQNRNFIFKPGISDKSEKDRNFKRKKISRQIKPIHDKLQNALYEILVCKYGKDNVGVETNTGNSNRIDVCLKTEKEFTLYEVKSYPSVMTSIRVAIGQLMEYAYYPNPISNLKELIIVSHLPIEKEDKEYLKIIRYTTKIKVYYQSLDLETKELTEKS